MTIVTRTELIKTNPDLVRRFVRATAKSWEEAKKNPGAAVDAAHEGEARPQPPVARSSS